MTRRCTFAVVAAGLLTAAARGQDPTLFLSQTPPPARGVVDNNIPRVQNILLRPNAAMPYYAYVGNDTPNDRTVSAVLLTADGDEVARVDNLAVRANTTAPVPFKGDDKPRAVAGRPVKLLLLNEKKEPIPARDPKVEAPLLLFRKPSDYTQVTAAFEGRYDGVNESRVSVTVPAGTVSGLPVKVRLDLSHVPELIPASIKDGALVAEIPATGGSAVLVARNLRFDGPPRAGWIAVSVDDYDRAWLFETAFDGTTPHRPNASNVVTIIAPKYAAPTDKFPVKVEVDQPNPETNLYIEFAFDKFGPSPFKRADSAPIPVETLIRPGDRDRAATMRLGPTGPLVFASVVKDWAFTLNASAVLGPRTLRARLLSQKGNAPDPANDAEQGHADRQVTFDDSPPVVSLKAPVEQVRGTPLRVTVSATDEESGVDRVLVFVGDPPAADVRGPVRGKVFLAAPGTAAGTFVAVLPMPDTKGPAFVGARVFNGVGLVTEAGPAEVMLIDPKVVVKPTTGAIKGVVEQGSPPRKQPTKPVYLLDEKQSAVVKKTETNDKGEFAFKDLPPGNYVVRSDKPTDYSTGNKAVTVEAGKTSEVAIDLKRAKPASPVKR